jgi:hypothetical protein
LTARSLEQVLLHPGRLLRRARHDHDLLRCNPWIVERLHPPSLVGRQGVYRLLAPGLRLRLLLGAFARLLRLLLRA